jgi:hypothetical protein
MRLKRGTLIFSIVIRIAILAIDPELLWAQSTTQVSGTVKVPTAPAIRESWRSH